MKFFVNSTPIVEEEFRVGKKTAGVTELPNQNKAKFSASFTKSKIRIKTSASTSVLPEVVRVKNASWAFSTRRVSIEAVQSVLPLEGSPNAGDLVLARVDMIGHHSGLQQPNGRRKSMFIGDEIVVAYGNRYASNQFESFVPETLGPCHLVAGGGIASRARSWHNRISKGPTHITPLGLLGDRNGRRMNLTQFALQPLKNISDKFPTAIAVVGTGMDSGKTQSAAYLVKGLIAAGLKVAYAKITGTGAGGDTWLLRDAGAFPVLDFTDAGAPSTYLMTKKEIENILVTLVGHISTKNVDTIILEIADGVYQQETAELLRSDIFDQIVGGVLFAARDSMGASAGVHWLSNYPTPVLALSGVLSAAPLQVKEATEALRLPVYNREELATAKIAFQIMNRAWQKHHELNCEPRKLYINVD